MWSASRQGGFARWAATLLVALACAAQAGWAQRLEATEASVKAAFLFKFAGFVEWPAGAFADASAPLVIGVLGSEEVATELEAIARGRHVVGRPVVVRRIGDPENVRGLHMIFVARREAGRLPAVARIARPQSILVVADSERGLESGSVINFVPVDDRLGFEVSVEAAERSGLRISSRMLGVARRVVGVT